MCVCVCVNVYTQLYSTQTCVWAMSRCKLRGHGVRAPQGAAAHTRIHKQTDSFVLIKECAKWNTRKETTPSTVRIHYCKHLDNLHRYIPYLRFLKLMQNLLYIYFITHCFSHAAHCPTEKYLGLGFANTNT